ncbi:MAG TPA: hypothetical protein VIK33_19090 [Anaerolineae bacterium]
MPTELDQAITVIRAGDKQAGRWLLAQALQANPREDKVWVWMSAVVDTDAQRRECLERALAINPNNELARRGLAKLCQPPAPPALPREVTPLPSVESPSLGTPLEACRAADTMRGSPGLVVAPLEITARPDAPRPGDGSPKRAEEVERSASGSGSTNQSLVDFVVGELSRNRPRNDIVMALCSRMNYSWNEAEKLIQKVERESRKQITVRRSPFLMVLSIGTIIGGLLLAGFGLYELSQGVLFFSVDLIVVYFQMPTPIMVITGLAMIGGGAWGALRTIGSLTRK